MNTRPLLRPARFRRPACLVQRACFVRPVRLARRRGFARFAGFLPSGQDSPAPGFLLLEVVVALGVLGVALLGILVALEAGVRRARAAEASLRALAAARAVADSAVATAPYVADWQRVGDAGPDGVPATADDGPPPESAPRCWRRVTRLAIEDHRWLWIEAACGPRPPDDATAAGGTASTWAAGVLADRVMLAVRLPAVSGGGT